MMTQYLLVNRERHPGRHGVTVWRYTWYCMEDGQLYETTVDNTFRNWQRSGWRELSADPQPWGIYTGLRRTQRRTQDHMPVITADHPARLEQRTTREEALEIMAQDYHDRRRVSEFSRMFAWDSQ